MSNVRTNPWHPAGFTRMVQSNRAALFVWFTVPRRSRDFTSKCMSVVQVSAFTHRTSHTGKGMLSVTT